MNKSYEVAILGPSSSFKTRTGRDIKDGIDGACLFPRGSVFRSTAEVLGKHGVPPHLVTSPMVEDILHNFIRSSVVDDIVTFQYGDGTLCEHTYQNGVLATNYAENPVVQTVLLQHIQDKTLELHKDYSAVIYEGRSSINNGLNIFLTAPTSIRTEIKKIECDVRHLSDEEIAKGIRRRDLQDAGKKIEPLKRPQSGYLIRRESVSDEEHEAIVQFGIDVIKNLQEGRMPLPQRQIIYTYHPEESALRERVPSYR